MEDLIAWATQEVIVDPEHGQITERIGHQMSSNALEWVIVRVDRITGCLYYLQGAHHAGYDVHGRQFVAAEDIAPGSEIPWPLAPFTHDLSMKMMLLSLR